MIDSLGMPPDLFFPFSIYRKINPDAMDNKK